jgi:tellurite resistance protein TehA-like permease
VAQDRCAVLNQEHPVRVRARIANGVRTVNPGYFALVMATGIVSVAMDNHGLPALSAVLLVLAMLCYAVLVVLTVWRLLAHPGRMLADLRDARIAFGFFTFVAGTDVLGTALVNRQAYGAALGLLVVGFVAWLVLGYVVPWTAVLGRSRSSPVLQQANGTWFIWVVASESVAVLAAALEPQMDDIRRELALLAVVSWAVGLFLYGAAGIFVAARMMLYPLGPRDLTPTYFVSMGATAITVVAGARIVQMADAPMVAATRGLAAGVSVVFWAFGTWLIPVLLAAGFWRHVIHRIPLTYTAPLWSVVFPLGMYGVGAHFLGQADDLPIVEAIGANESWLALAVWALTFAGLLYHLVRTVLLGPGGGDGTGGVITPSNGTGGVVAPSNRDGAGGVTPATPA